MLEPLIKPLTLLGFLAVNLVAFALWAPPAGAMTLSDATDRIHALGNDAQAVLTQGDLSRAQREAAFAELLEESFALATIGRHVLGDTWQTASELQRASFQKVFNRYLLQTFAARMGEVVESRFRIDGAEALSKLDVQVTMVVGAIPGLNRELNWRLRDIGGDHRVVDVLIDGISMASTLRQEFGSVIRSHDLDSLMAVLEAKTRSLIATAR